MCVCVCVCVCVYMYVFVIAIFKNQVEKESQSWKGTSFVLYSPGLKSKLFFFSLTVRPWTSHLSTASSFLPHWAIVRNKWDNAENFLAQK